MDVQVIQAESQLEIWKSEMNTLNRWISRLNEMKERESNRWRPNAAAEFEGIVAMMEERGMNLLELSKPGKRPAGNNDNTVRSTLRLT